MMLMRLKRLKIRVLTGVFLGLAAVMPATADIRQLAAIGEKAPDQEKGEPEIPWSAQVLEIQRALDELGLYRGPINGRLNAATEKAIRRFEIKFGRIGQGGLSPDGILNLSAVTNAVRIQRLLEKSRERQVIRARAALQENAKTRDLVGGVERWARGSADITYTATCTPATMTQCSLARALDEIAKIKRADYRDWALRDAVRVIANLGEEKVGREVIGKISDPRLILVALREMAEGLAHADRPSAARNVALAIPDIRNRAKAIASIAIAHFTKGKAELGRRMIREMLDVLVEEPSMSIYVSLVTEMSHRLVRRGQRENAVELVRAAERRVADREPDSKLDSEWGMVATAYAALGDKDATGRALERIKNADTRQSLILPTAEIFSEDLTTNAASEKKSSPARLRNLVVAMNNFAGARQASGDLDGAKLLVERAGEFLKLLDRSYASDYARAHFIDRALTLGMTAEAVAVIEKINRKTLRIKKSWSFVAFGVETISFESALADTEKVANLFERCLIYLHASRVLGGRLPSALINRLIAKAHALTDKMTEPWWRARALISLAETYRANATVRKN